MCVLFECKTLNGHLRKAYLYIVLFRSFLSLDVQWVVIRQFNKDACW